MENLKNLKNDYIEACKKEAYGYNEMYLDGELEYDSYVTELRMLFNRMLDRGLTNEEVWDALSDYEEYI